MKTTTNQPPKIDLQIIVTSVFFRILLFLSSLTTIFLHFLNFYTQVWHTKEYALFWALSHISISIYLVLKPQAFDNFVSSGFITIYVIGITYILHSNILHIDIWTFKGLNIILMKGVIILITISGALGIAITFHNDKP